MKQYYVYILASKKNGTLYIGITNNLTRRVYEHKNNMFEGFSQKYNVHNLVYYEEFNDVQESLIKSRGLKKWKRQWNIELIEKFNPQWKDLYDEISGFLLPFFKGTSFAGMTDSVQE